MLFRITKFCKAAVAVVFTIVAIYSCSETKKTNREMFEAQIQESVNVGMKLLINQGNDSVAARNYMVCMSETMYQIDSTFFLKGRDYSDELINNNRDKFEKCQKYLSSKDSVQKVPELDLK